MQERRHDVNIGRESELRDMGMEMAKKREIKQMVRCCNRVEDGKAVDRDGVAVQLRVELQRFVWRRCIFDV